MIWWFGLDESRIETTTGMCVVALTKYLMKKQNLDYEKAYKKLLGMELYNVKIPTYEILQERDERLEKQPEILESSES